MTYKGEGMFEFCPVHKCELNFFVSSVLYEKIQKNIQINAFDIAYIVVETEGNKCLKHAVDKKFFEKYFSCVNESIVYLKDRNRNTKEMNDRLVIKRIEKELYPVCKKCFQSLLIDVM